MNPSTDPRGRQRPPTREEEHQALVRQYGSEFWAVVYELRWWLMCVAAIMLMTAGAS